MSKRKDHPQIEDQQADRMKRTGCLLLILAPLLVLTYAAAVLTKPLIEMTKPRAEQTVIPQRESEVLVITATFAGDDGYETANRVDETLYDLIVTNYETSTLRAGRVDQTPTTEEEALALATEYGASALLWGEVGSDDLTARISIIDPMGAWEPTAQTFALIAGDDLHESKLAEYLFNVMIIHSAEAAGAYRYEYASGGFFNLYHSSPHTPFFAPLTAIYQITCDLYSQDTVSIRQTLDLALSEHPTAALYILSAKVSADVGDSAAAQAALAQARALDPTLSLDDPLMARLLILNGDLSEARMILDRLIAADRQEPTLLLERARLHDAMSLANEADADYRAYLALMPTDFVVQFEFIDRLIARKEWQMVETTLADMPTEVDWNNPPPFTLEDRLALARIKLQVAEGNTEGALLTAQNEITDTTLQTAIIGAIYADGGDAAEAEAIWDASFLYSPEGMNQLAWLLAINAWAAVAEPYARQASEGSADPNFMHTLGYIRLKVGEPQQALVSLEAAYQSGQMLAYPEIEVDLGEAYLAMGDYEQAITHYMAFLSESTYTAVYQRDLILFHLAEARYRLQSEG